MTMKTLDRDPTRQASCGRSCKPCVERKVFSDSKHLKGAPPALDHGKICDWKKVVGPKKQHLLLLLLGANGFDGLILGE